MNNDKIIKIMTSTIKLWFINLKIVLENFKLVHFIPNRFNKERKNIQYPIRDPGFDYSIFYRKSVMSYVTIFFPYLGT